MKTIFIKFNQSPTINLIKSLSTISVNTDENIKSDYIFFNEHTFKGNLDYCIRHNLSSNYTSLINKHSSYELYNKYNFSTLPAIKPLHLSDVENFEGDKFFIKPVIGCGSNKYFHTHIKLLAQAYYIPINKQSILDILSIESSSLWDTQQKINEGFILQRYADVYENSQINWYVQYGSINGNGNVFFTNPVIGVKNKHISTTSYSSENISDEILNIQTKIQDLISGENIKNCVFNMQFLKINGTYAPVDFNFRLGYHDIYIDNQFSELNWGRSLIEYAYDITDSIPVRPQISTAIILKYSSELSVIKDKIEAHGQTKQEALSNLQNLTNT